MFFTDCFFRPLLCLRKDTIILEKSDFDPKIIKLSENYSYAISGGLIYSLGLDKDSFSQKDLDCIQSNLLFFLRSTTKLDSIDDNGEEIV